MHAEKRSRFNADRQLYTPATRAYESLADLACPWHDREITIASCGRLCLHRKKINISTVLAGQKLGIKEVDEARWLVGFMHHDLGYIDLEQRTLQTIDNPFGSRLSPMSQECTPAGVVVWAPFWVPVSAIQGRISLLSREITGKFMNLSQIAELETA